MIRLSLAAAIACVAAMASAQTTETLAEESFLTSAGRELFTQKILGPQVTTLNAMAGAFTVDAEGKQRGYASIMGEPAMLAKFDARSGEQLKVMPIPEASGNYQMLMASDGTLYLASHPKGNFYRLKPGADAVENLGVPVKGVTFIWQLAETPDGKIYGACYPKSTLFEFDPKTEKFRDLGPVVEGEDYARSITWHPVHKKLYIGVGSHSSVIELDPATGERRDILPAEHKSSTFAYYVAVAGKYVLARMDPSGKALVLDPVTGKVVTSLPGFNSVGASKPQPGSDAVYYSAFGELHSYKPGDAQGQALGVKVNSQITGFEWMNSGDGKTSELVTLWGNGTVNRYNPEARGGKKVPADLPQQPIHIHNIMGGPDGKVYSSGYVVGKVGVFDPESGSNTLFANVKQAEGMTPYGSKIYFGTYPKAPISVYDTASTLSKSNPKTLFSLGDENQDRPFGMLAVPEIKKVFVGTVPAYGSLGGVLAVYDPVTSDLQVHHGVVKDQAVVNFAWRDGTLFAGTTIFGGLGIPAVAKEAVLFGWDSTGSTKTFEVVPVPGKRAISGLQFGSDGMLYGWAEGTVFVFDPKERKVVRTREHFPSKEMEGHIWRGGYMLPEQDGSFMGANKGTIYRLDPKSLDITVLAEGPMSLLARDLKGRYYSVLRDKLVQFSPVTRVTSEP